MYADFMFVFIFMTGTMIMNTIAICGLGGAGKEILDLVERSKADRWNNIIFCDKTVDDAEKIFRGYQVFTFEQITEMYQPDMVEFIISVGDVYLRRKIYDQIMVSGYNLATLIAPGVNIPKSTLVCDGVIIRDNCYISVDVVLESNSMIQPNTVIGHDVRVGKNSIISSQSVIAGATLVGNNTYIALGCIVKELVTIGDDTIVSMGTVVNKNIDSGVIVRGDPMEVVSKNYLKSAFRLNTRK